MMRSEKEILEKIEQLEGQLRENGDSPVLKPDSDLVRNQLAALCWAVGKEIPKGRYLFF